MAIVTVPKAVVQVTYNQKDISRSLDADFISLHVTDKLNGESDELKITLHDAHDKWSNDWYAGKGDTLAVTIRDDLGVLDAGIFEIDEIEVNGHNPQTVTLKHWRLGLVTHSAPKTILPMTTAAWQKSLGIMPINTDWHWWGQSKRYRLNARRSIKKPMCLSKTPC